MFEKGVLPAFCALLFVLTPGASKALTQGDYTYTVANNKATITDFTYSYSGSLSIPSTLGGYTVVNIGDYAFYNCQNLTSVIIPNSVTNIGTAAFWYCSSLQSVTIGSGVINIGDRAFAVSGLTGVTIPSTITTIGEGAFASCSSLIEIIIPRGVTAIGDNAFCNCSSLTTIIVDSFNPVFSSVDGVLFKDNSTTLCQYPPGKVDASYTIPVSVNSFTPAAFYACAHLVALDVVPQQNLFRSVNGVLFNTTLTEIIQYPPGKVGSYVIPASVTNIGAISFASNTNLFAVTIPLSVTSIGYEAFSGCPKLSSITIPDSVITVGDLAFFDCPGLTSVLVGNHVERIGEYAFAWCISLFGIYFSGDAPEVGADVFYANANEGNVTTAYYLSGTIGWGESLGGASAMLWNPQVPFSYILDNGGVVITKYLGNSAYVTIPASIENVPVTSISFPGFAHRSDLKQVVIPNGVTNIGQYAFEYCSGLASITFPASVTYMGLAAFVGCNNLTTVFFEGNAPLVDSHNNWFPLFSTTPATIYYYSGTTGWATTWEGRPTIALIRSTPPLIIAHPTSQAVTAGSTVLFRTSALGSSPLTFEWFHNGQPINGANSEVLTINNVQSDQGGWYSTRISNGYGSQTSSSAKLTVLGGEQYHQETTQLPEPGAPQRLIEEDSLIIITHGYQALGAMADVRWTEDMAEAIRSYLSAQGLNNWKVETVNWKEWAWPTPSWALGNATIIGSRLGKKLAAQTWSHVHLIGHSAGSALIQSAADEIRTLSPNTSIHTTFLDPYVGVDNHGRLLYGRNADWSDNYFSDDWTGYSTRARLPYAHNVNVTRLDPANTSELLCFYSDTATPGTIPSIVCSAQQENSSHPWPHDFYLSTIAPNSMPGSIGYGFPRSKEGGGWDGHTDYPLNNDPIILGGSTYLQGNGNLIATVNVLDLTNSVLSLVRCSIPRRVCDGKRRIAEESA